MSWVLTHVSQNEAMMSVHGGVPEKSMQYQQDVRNVSIFSCNKMIYVARQE